MLCVQEVPYMVTERLEVRLDPADRRKLAKLAEEERRTLSDTIRCLIDQAYEAYMLERRREAARRIAEAYVGEAMEPEELNRLMDEAHSPGDLC
jgi:predicted transcriptional regulator